MKLWAKQVLRLYNPKIPKKEFKLYNMNIVFLKEKKIGLVRRSYSEKVKDNK